MSDASPSGSRLAEERFDLTRYTWLLVAIIAFGWWPVVGVYLTALFAAANGCEVSAEGPVPCLAFGSDWGPFIHDASGLNAIFGFTMPTALILLIVWATVLTSSFLIWRRRRSSVLSDPATVRWSYYAISLIVLLVLAWATLTGKLPAMVILVVIFGGLFWISSLIFAVVSLLMKAARNR